MIRKDIVLIALIVTILTLMIIPLPSGLIDFLITLNISLAVLLLMVSIYLRNPSDFSTFPSVILISTAFRLALSVGTTRLILADADGGQIIETFGDFVVSGSVVIGLVIFLIITVVQFLVVTKGAERVAEVGARFALDAMPGKQMSIDADVRAGNIEQEEAVERRKQLDKDSQFFGAMDGAMKFVKGDAIAGLIITTVNLIGGIAIGVGVHGLSIGEATSIYSILTIGDGLVAQIPALVMSLVAGMIVTRAVNNENVDLGSDIFKELLSDVRVPAMAAAVVFGVGLIPGFPTLLFVASSLGMILAALMIRHHYRLAEAEQAEEDEEAEKLKQHSEKIETFSSRLRVRVGVELEDELDLTSVQYEVEGMFAQLNHGRGIDFPPPEITQSEGVSPRSFVIELDEVPLRDISVPEESVLVEGGSELIDLIESKAQEVVPIDLLNGQYFWVKESLRSRLNALNFEPVIQEIAFAELIFRLYEQNLGQIFGKTEFEAILENLLEVDEETTNGLIDLLTRPTLHHIFRLLVEDGVPLRPYVLLSDALSNLAQAHEGAPAEVMAELMRVAMKRQLCRAITGEGNLLGLVVIDPKVEKAARESLADLKRSGSLSAVEGLVFEPNLMDMLLGKFEKINQAQKHSEGQLAIIVSADLRRRLQNFLAANKIHIPVLAPHELSPDVTTFPIELLTLEGGMSPIDPKVLGRREEAKIFEQSFLSAEAVPPGSAPAA